MRNAIKELNKQLESCSYNKVYTALITEKIDITFENLTKLFSKVNSIHLHSFLIYCLSKKPTPDIYVAICENYLYVSPRIEDVYSVIYYYMKQALAVFPNNKMLADWIITTFSCDPSSPFSKEELNKIMNILD